MWYNKYYLIEIKLSTYIGVNGQRLKKEGLKIKYHFNWKP